MRNLPRITLTAVTLVIATGIIAPLLIVVSVLPRSALATYHMARIWSYVIAKAMGLTFSVHGGDKLVPGTSYIYLPNHQGNAEILALFITLPSPYRWVIKKSLLKIPIFGWALGRTGAISLDRSKGSESIKKLQQSGDKLKDGWCVLCYPEGTRTLDGQLLPFKKGAFLMAVHTGVPLLPITVNGAFKVLPKKTVAFQPGHITVTMGDPIETKGMTEADVPALMEKARAEISKHLNVDYDPTFKHLA